MIRLRDKMIEDMKLGGLEEETQISYVRAVRDLCEVVGKPPLRVTREDVRRFLLDMVDGRGLSGSTVKVTICGLRFFYRKTVKKPEVVDQIAFPRVDSTLPDVLSGSEVKRLFDAIEDIRLRAAVSLIYSTGMRVSEVVRLEIRDIDSKRMVIHIRTPKNRYSHFVPLSKKTLGTLRGYYIERRPEKPWLFPGKNPGKPVATDTIQRHVRYAARRAGIDKRVTPHILRHTAATHMLESGVDLRMVQTILGHRSLRSTSRYLHVTSHALRKVRTPVDVMDTPDAEALG